MQQFPQIAPYPSTPIIQQVKLQLCRIRFDEQLISKLIVALNSSKVHGHDGLSIRMLQIGSDSIPKPLLIIFQSCQKVGYFPPAWNNANVSPVHPKGN